MILFRSYLNVKAIILQLKVNKLKKKLNKTRNDFTVIAEMTPDFYRLPGSSPSRIQGYPQDDGLGDKDSKVEKSEV